MLQPNQLSIALVPNRLSVLEQQRVGRTATDAVPQRPAISREASRPRVNLSTIIAAAVFAIVVFGQILRACGQ